ncbi:MAG: cation:proton antiporter [Sedimentibacter sp.]|uniref:cation:proton antiporter n=1 Tax=Sedimentibacter sp. TaxID=1960295 RepID=UPI003158172D
MLTSLALIFLIGMLMGSVFKKMKLPSLLGMLLTGIVLGPHVLNLLDSSILGISAELRKLALIIILARAGLSLDVKDLIKVGRPAFLMCFVPACFEIIGMIVLAPRLLGVSILDAAIMGAVVGAVSPAVVVPKMLNLMENGYGTDKSIPQLILAGASVDDVFVIVMFTSFTGLAMGENISASSFLEIPASIVLGLVGGVVVGLIVLELFKRFHMRDSNKVIVMLSIAFMLVAAESKLTGILPFSGLLAVMSMGVIIQKYNQNLAERVSSKFSKLWVAAELILFVLVGAAVDIKYAAAAGISSILLIAGVLIFRMIGVYFCLLKTQLSNKERLFCMIAYTPKATVQAAIGSVPLARGLSCGQIVLTVAVIAILITAPLGAFGIDMTHKKLLYHNSNHKVI